MAGVRALTVTWAIFYLLKMMQMIVANGVAKNQELEGVRCHRTRYYNFTFYLLLLVITCYYLLLLVITCYYLLLLVITCYYLLLLVIYLLVISK
jgi:hypothetical protein